MGDASAPGPSGARPPRAAKKRRGAQRTPPPPELPPVAAAADADDDNDGALRVPWESLPQDVLRCVLDGLLLDARLRFAGVCTGWRAAAADARLWTRLDVGAALAAAIARGADVSERSLGALLRAAAARARGRLTALDVSGCAGLADDALRAAVRGNATTLTELHLRGAARLDNLGALLRAAPQLRLLDVSDMKHTCALANEAKTELTELLASRAPATLRTLLVCDDLNNTLTHAQTAWRTTHLATLLAALPQLTELHARVWAENAARAGRVLRNEAPFERLRVRGMQAALDDDDAVRELVRDAAAHAPFRELIVHGARVNAAAMHALADALAEDASSSSSSEDGRAPRASLSLLACICGEMSDDGATALTRLLSSSGSSGGVRDLRLTAVAELCALDDAAIASRYASALSASALTTLVLDGSGWWRTPAAAAALLRGLVAHPTLTCVVLTCLTSAAAAFARQGADGDGDGAACVAAQLGALLAADAPALRTLQLGGHACVVPGVARALFGALPRNAHLLSLDVRGLYLSAACVRDDVLPAVRANGSLRALQLGMGAGIAFGLEADAMAFVHQRAAAGRRRRRPRNNLW
jgi:hypothetical protein